MATDPNWLMSTAAQSAAALVAIVGGFLVSRVIALTADRRAAELSHAEARNRIALLERRLAGAKKKLATWDAAELYDEMLEQLLEARGEIGALELLAYGPRPRRDDSAVLAMLQPRLEAISTAFDVLEPLFAEGVPTGEDLQHAIAQHGRRRTMHTALRHVYNYLKEAHETRQRDEKERSEAAHRNARSPLSFPPQFRLPEIPVFEPPAERVARNERRQQLLDAMEQIENDLSDHRAEESLAARIAQSAMTSGGVRGGFVVLVFFAITGVVVPIWTIALQPPSLSSLHRAVLVALFLVGLLLLMGYLARIIVRLRQSGSLPLSTHPPESVVEDVERGC